MVMEAGVFNSGGQEQDTTVTAEAQARLAPIVRKVCQTQEVVS